MAYPSAGSLVQLAHARALREDFVSPGSCTPLYLRKPDAEINWPTRDGGRSLMAARRAAPAPTRPTLDGRRSARCAAATCAAVLRIEQQVYPRPWSIGLFLSELGHRGSRVYVVARVGARRSWATAG